MLEVKAWRSGIRGQRSNESWRAILSLPVLVVLTVTLSSAKGKRKDLRLFFVMSESAVIVCHEHEKPETAERA